MFQRIRQSTHTIAILLFLGLSAGLATSFSFAVCTVAATFTHWFPTNVKAFGAIGNNVADDTVAIQAAIDATATGGQVFFPPGNYKVTSTLNVPSPKRLSFRGVSPIVPGGSEILGSIAGGPLIDMANSAGGGVAGTIIEGLALRNTHATGVTLEIAQMQTPGIKNASIGGYRGVISLGNVYSLSIDNVKFTSAGNVAGSIGLYAGSHTYVSASDFVGWDEGIRASGATVSIVGCRFEVNRYGMWLGKDLAGSTFALGRSLISGNSFEANTVAIKTTHVGNIVLSGIAIQGSTTSPGGFSEYGIDLAGASDVELAAIGIGGPFNSAGIRVNSFANRLRISRVSVSNTTANRKVWDIQVPLSLVEFESTNYSPRGDGIVVPSMTTQLTTQALSAVNFMEPHVVGRNLRGKNIAVGSGATTLAVVFQTEKATGQAVVSSATPGTGAGTLPNGTYYYAGAVVTESGETSVFGEQSATTTGGQNQVAIGVGPISGPTNWKRRIYRGIAPGVYDGYFETPLNAATFTDTGTAFTGRKSPMVSANDVATSMQEPDANYAVIVTPAWNTSVWVTSKATTGFTVNFGTAPGSASVLDWFIVR